MASMSVSGVVSGMDWESMITSIIESASKPAQVQVNKRTNLVNKKSLFEEMKVTMNSIQSSLSPLKLPSTYKAKEIEIERIDSTGSYKGVLTATVNADAAVNVYDLEVKQLARAQTNRSSQITASTLKSTLGSIESSKLYINAGNQKIGIDVYNSDSLDSLKSRINTTLKTLSVPVDITASVVDNRLILKSDSTGLGTTSVSGTASQRYNTSGYTDLSTIITDADAGQSVNIFVDDSNAENLKVSSGSSKYSIHKDYEVVNNQIRWKQYEDNDTVKLGESVTASYTLGTGDVYTKTAKRGSGDSDSIVFGLDVIDNGTLSQRMKIRGNKTTTTTTTEEKSSLGTDEEIGSTTNTVTTQDSNGDDIVTKTTIKISESTNDDGDTVYKYETTTAVTQMTDFVYGKDFTFDSGKITWLEQESETNEPDSYTVSFSEDASVNYSVSGTKKSEATTYTTEPDSYSTRITTGAKGTFETTVTKGSMLTDQIIMSFEDLNTAYKGATGSDIHFQPVTSNGNTRYILDPDNSYLADFTITSNGTTYQYGRDFVIRTTNNDSDTSDLSVVWASSSSNGTTDSGIVKAYDNYKGITINQALQEPATGSTFAFDYAYDYEETLSGKVNKGDNDKRLETVFGSEIDSTYYNKLEIYGYEYDKDYTVNSNGEIEWLEQTGEVNSEDDATVFDVDEFNTAYKKATGADISTITITGSDGVIRTYLDPTDRTLFNLTDENGTEYEYGRDYVIRVKDDGNGYVLSWFAADDKTGDGTIDANDANIAVSAYAQEKNISTLNFNKAPDTGVGYTFGFSSTGTNEHSASVNSSDEDKSLATLFEDLTIDESDYSNIVIKSGSTTYTYGRDFTVTDGAIEWLPKYEVIKTYKTEEQEVTVSNKPEAFTLSYDTEEYDSTTDSDSDLSNVIAAANGDYEHLTLEDSDGFTYFYVDDESDLDEYSYTIVDGAIKWYETTETQEVTVVVEETKPLTINTPSAPDASEEYTIYYESFKPIETAIEADGEDEIELKIANDYGKISDSGSTYLSYEQILKDVSTKLSTSSSQDNVDEVLKNYFTITDEDGETYTYGDDFIIKMGDEDLTSEQHKAVIEWVTSGPTSGTSFTVSYTGRGEGGGEVYRMNNAVTRTNSDVVMSSTSGTPDYDEFAAGTTTITQGAKTFFEGYDFEVSKNDDGNVLINWKTGTNWEWYYPTSGQYTINLTTESGASKTFTAYRDTEDTLDLRNFGFETVGNNGSLTSITFDGTTYDLTSTTTDDDGKTPSDLVKEKLGIDINSGTNGGVRVYNFDWIQPAQTSREGLPGIGDEISIEYEYNTNTFTISDDGDGVVDLLGLNDDITEAQNAILVLDGEEIERDLNNIGESYGNELIKGMTINLKGVGEVSMDVSHDAEKAVTSIQTFVDNYNSLMSWMNTRMTESQVDEDTAATIDSDDFRMRWGLLHGNSLLRSTKSQMRDTVAQNFTFSFTTRTSSEEIYGAMSYNGLKADSTLRLRINSTYVDVPVLMTDTIQDIADKINDKDNPAMKNIFYDSDGQLLGDPLIKAKVEGDKLVISSSSNDEITMSGTAAMNALKMNYTYKGLYQLGIATTSNDYGKSGELEFDTEKFMSALEDNPDEVESLMLKFTSTMDTWTKSMLNSSASGQTSGTLTRQISDLETQISSIDEYLEKYQDRLDRMEESLRTKYAAAEQTISKLSQQASAISAILQQLSGNSNSNSSSS